MRIGGESLDDGHDTAWAVFYATRSCSTCGHRARADSAVDVFPPVAVQGAQAPGPPSMRKKST
jgi:hypothetical protein